jgi:hypothetical protein
MADYSNHLLAPGHTTRAADGMTAPIRIKSFKNDISGSIPLLGKYRLSFGADLRS